MGAIEIRSWQISRRLLVAGAAAALAVPLLTGSPANSAPQTQHLLSVLGDDLTTVATEVVESGGEVLQTFEVADALLVKLPVGVLPPTGAVAVPDSAMKFQSTDTAGDAAPVNTYRDTLGVPGGKDGSGVTVALVDTGVADTDELNVTHVNVSGGEQGDGLGHGTFLAGLVAGSGASSGGAYKGVAPGAKVLDVQVAMPDGSTSMSRVLAGLQAVADANQADPSVKVVNLALNSGSPLPPWIDPLTRGLETLWSKGMTVVVAAGNDGPDEISSPASDPTLLATGSVDENKTAGRGDDTLADFSSYGKAFGFMRPDVSAPGVSLVSLRAPGSAADVENPGSVVLDKYFKGTGTSMSAAVASGAAAVLVAERPGLSPNDVKRLFMGTAYSGNLAKGAGAGGVDLGKALNTSVADLPALAFDPVSTEYGPNEDDAATWAAFGEAWAAGDLKAVVDAWVQLSPKTRKWAANAWSLAVLGRSLTMSDDNFEGRRWSGRRWSTEAWNGRRWSLDKWVGRRWSDIDWGSAEWAPATWDKMDWAGRRWSSEDWLAFAWTTRNISLSGGDSWKVDGDDWDFDGRRWSGRRWSTTDWAGRRWSDEAWAGRRWSDFVYEGRRWSEAQWAGRRWSDNAWIGRRWSQDEWQGRRWSGRRWSDSGWSGRRWSDEEWDGRRWSGRRWSEGSWDGRRWSEFTAEARDWANEDWSGRRWS